MKICAGSLLISTPFTRSRCSTSSAVFLTDVYPLDIDFVLDLPEELRDLFNDWAQGAEYVPPNT
jgi:hypothetical protein